MAAAAAAKGALEGAAGFALSQVGDLAFPRFEIPAQRFALPAHYLERSPAWWYPYTLTPAGSHLPRPEGTDLSLNFRCLPPTSLSALRPIAALGPPPHPPTCIATHKRACLANFLRPLTWNSCPRTLLRCLGIQSHLVRKEVELERGHGAPWEKGSRARMGRRLQVAGTRGTWSG